MWDRKILKANAKIALSGKYWQAFLAYLLASLVSGLYSYATLWQTTAVNEKVSQLFAKGTFDSEYLSAVAVLYRFESVGFLFSIFVGMPISIGVCRYFVQNHFGVTNTSTVFSGFRRRYGTSVGGMFTTILLIILWAMLLIIPGIIKALEYSMVPFILSDNPALPGSHAREISRRMTKGEKGAIFVLALSFLGWIFVAAIAGDAVAWMVVAALSATGTIAGGIIRSVCLSAAMLFLSPYMIAVFTELYLFLRDRAIQYGDARPEEFGLVPAAGPAAPAGPAL